MRFFFTALACTALLGACRSAPVAYANTECGNCPASLPPLLRPSRAVDPRLEIARRGALVVILEAADRPTPAMISLQPAAARGHSIDQPTSPSGIATFDTLVAGEYTVQARHIGLQVQSLRVLVSVGFVDTVRFGLGQP